MKIAKTDSPPLSTLIKRLQTEWKENAAEQAKEVIEENFNVHVKKIEEIDDSLTLVALDKELQSIRKDYVSSTQVLTNRFKAIVTKLIIDENAQFNIGKEISKAQREGQQADDTKRNKKEMKDLVDKNKALRQAMEKLLQKRINTQIEKLELGRFPLASFRSYFIQNFPYHGPPLMKSKEIKDIPYNNPTLINKYKYKTLMGSLLATADRDTRTAVSDYDRTKARWFLKRRNNSADSYVTGTISIYAHFQDLPQREFIFSSRIDEIKIDEEWASKWEKAIK